MPFTDSSFYLRDSPETKQLACWFDACGLFMWGISKVWSSTRSFWIGTWIHLLLCQKRKHYSTLKNLEIKIHVSLNNRGLVLWQGSTSPYGRIYPSGFRNQSNIWMVSCLHKFPFRYSNTCFWSNMWYHDTHMCTFHSSFICWTLRKRWLGSWNLLTGGVIFINPLLGSDIFYRIHHLSNKIYTL